MMRTATSIAALLGALGLAAGCGATDSNIGSPLVIDRPVDVTFACYGGMRVVGDNGTADLTDPLVSSSMPTTACDARSQLPRVIPPGQETLPDPTQNDPKHVSGPDVVSWYGFILQSVPGTLAMVSFQTQRSEEVEPGIGVTLHDADGLVPGVNAVAVGDLPVAIGTDRAGCQMVTANDGTCDLSIIDVASLADLDDKTPPLIRSQSVVNATGATVLAKASAIAAEPPEDAQPIGAACPADPEGLMYIAYPACHLVAAVRTGTGTIEAGIRFNGDGTVDITDGNVSCPDECGDNAVGETPGERPVALDLVHDARIGTRRLVIGSDNSPQLTVVELGADYKPTSVQRVALEGNIGITSVAMSPQIGMGGSADIIDDSGTTGGQHQFVYAVATDSTVRVADITGTYTECDTQVDPRYLRGVTDVQFLSCMPVGDVRTPPRRAGARGPGIQTTLGAAPLSVAIVASDPVDPKRTDKNGNPLPLMPVIDGGNLVGYFAAVTTAYGDTQVIDVDDDAYPDLWSDTNNSQLDHELNWIVPHQIRDYVTNADAIAQGKDANNTTVPVCDQSGPPSSSSSTTAASLGGPRLDATGVTTVIDQRTFDSLKQFALPGIQRTLCHDGVTGNDSAVSSLSFAATVPQRDLDFPDWFATRSETWTVAWEGPLSRDSVLQSIDGPVNRNGIVGRSGNGITITDPSRPFCQMGSQPYDYAILVGCDPTQGDAQCGLDETCYVHPDATVATGSCLPKAQADLLASTCRDYLITLRRYAILTDTAGQIRAVPRRHILDTSPVDGCTSDDQCTQLAAYQAYLDNPDHPPATPPTIDHSYKCEDDPTRGGGINRCVETCQTSADCDDGTVCSNGTCIEGVVPPSECVPTIQRYQVRAGEEMVVTGSVSGFVHNIVEDPNTGECVPDPTANPLLIGRIPLTAPPCPGPDSPTAVTPNPCMTTVPQAENEPQYVAGSCTLANPPSKLVTRDAPAIRFKNRSLTFNLVDPTYPGDAQCRNDRQGNLGLIPSVRNGFQLQIPITQGFSTLRLGAPAVFPIKVRHGPSASLWVMDEGDLVPTDASQTSTRGQVFKIEATNLGTVNTIQ